MRRGKRLGARIRNLLRPPYHRMVWALLVLAFALVILIARVDPDRAWPVAALLVFGILIAAVEPDAWSELLSRVESVNAGPFGIVAATAAASEAAKKAPAPDTQDSEEKPAAKAENMFELKVRLEAKLTYVAKHLLAPADASPEFLTVGSLVYDKFLTPAEGKLAYAIVSIRQEELDALPEAERLEFLRDAETFVAGVRASIFWGQVKRRLKGRDAAKDKSLFLECVPTSGRRDDFVAGTREREYRVAPAFAFDRDSRTLTRAINRLMREDDERHPLERRIVVIPDRSHEPEKLARDDSPKVVKLAGLRSLLEEG